MVPWHVGMIAQCTSLSRATVLHAQWTNCTATFFFLCFCQHVYHPCEKLMLHWQNMAQAQGLPSLSMTEIMGPHLPNILASIAVGSVPLAGLTWVWQKKLWEREDIKLVTSNKDQHYIQIDEGEGNRGAQWIMRDPPVVLAHRRLIMGWLWAHLDHPWL